MELRIKNLSKRYESGVQALEDVSLTISAGMFGLLGPNGAGKSTLMRTIATLQEPDSGSISLDTIDVLKEKDKVRRLLGYLPQEFGLYPKVTAWEMLDHFARLKGISNSRARKNIVQAILVQTNLFQARHKRLGGFSGGMKQRFGIAQALLGDPKLIIVDEPTAGLDPEERVRFLNLLSEIGENIIVILSTHIVDDVSDLCGQMAVINDGRVLLTGDPLALADSLEGKIWKRFIVKSELPTYQTKYQVISSRLVAGRPLIHIFSDDRPDSEFQPVAPELEDLYFLSIRRTATTPQGNGLT